MDHGGDRNPRRPRRPAARPRPEDRWEEDDRDDEGLDELDGGEEEDLDAAEYPETRRAASRRRPGARRTRTGRRPGRRMPGPSLWERLGLGGEPSRRRGRRGLDWSDVEDDEAVYDDEEPYSPPSYDDEEPEDTRESHGETRRRPQRRSRRPREEERRKLTLMDLCMPVYGFAATLPRDPAETQPDYDTFRKEILAALQRIEEEAREQRGIEAEDAREASYALSLFLDEQVGDSGWQGRERWATEPLHIVLHRDAEGGENFFRRLEEMGNRQRAVKEIFLVCLSLGYRGKYAALDPAQQAARIGEIRQKVLRSIHPVPLEKQPVLFPKAYRAAAPVADTLPPCPRWWVMASGGTLVAVLLLWFILFWVAGWLPRGAIEDLRRIQIRPPRAAAGVPAGPGTTPAGDLPEGRP